MLYGFITIWFSVGCRVALELGFCMLFKVICLRECNVFSGWGNASRQVNELLAKKDRIIERQSNKWTRFFWVTKLRVDKLTSCLFSFADLCTQKLVTKTFLCYSVFYLPCLQATCPLVHLSTYFVTLSFIYSVYKQLVNSSTRWLVHLPCYQLKYRNHRIKIKIEM